MKKETWGWVAGGTIFAIIASVWFWQLPTIIKYTAGKGDNGLSGIAATIGGAKKDISGDLEKAQEKIKASMKEIDGAVKADTTNAAIIEDVKQKINNRNDVKAASVNNPVGELNPANPAATTR